MKRYLLGLFLSVSALAGTVQREFSATSTATWTAVSSIPTDRVWRSIVIRNETDGDVAIAFGITTFPDLIIPFNTDVTVTNPALGENRTDYVGTFYVRNSTGTGGNVGFTLIDNNARQFALAKSGSNSSVGANGSPSPSSSTLVAGQNPSGDQQPLQTSVSGRLLIDGTGAVSGSVCSDLAVTTSAATCTAPATAIGFTIQASSSNTENLRFAVGTTASSTVGVRLEPGRSEFLPVGANVSYISESGSGQEVQVQWVTQ